MADSDPDCSLPSEKNEDDGGEDFSAHDPMDTFKILITTDNHLGYMERDPERGQDSFVSLEEAFDLAKVEQVDFILLGGDLFHENKPSRDCLTKCQKIFRDFCFGDKPLEFEILSDEKKNFGHTGVPLANFNDPNLNISIPVFSIHGNHDDPTGQQNLCALDTLAVAGLMNYFGKSNTSCDQGIEIVPILLEKGRTKLAIYGLGAIKDERLYNMFEKGLVQFVRPAEQPEEWFNIFLIHQNRSAHSKKNYIPETFLPEFLDLVIWGHEHECRIRPEYNELQRFYVSQPGSSVITSLSESELAPKHVALLKVHEKSFKLEPLPLRTVRQFAMDTVVLSECGLKETDKNAEAKVEQMLTKRIDKLVDECAKNRYFCEKQPTKPLIRIKVDYSGTSFEPINEIRFAQKMVAKLANPKNIFQIYKKSEAKKEEGHLDVEAAKVLRMHGGGELLEYDKVQDLVSKYFKKADEKNKMLVLTEKGLGDAIQEYIEKDEKDAIGELVNFQIEKMQKYLKNEAKWENEYQLHNEIKKFQEMRVSNQKQEEDEMRREVFDKCTNRSRTTQPSRVANNDSDDEGSRGVVGLDSDEEGVPPPTATTTTGRGRGRGRGSRGGGRGATAATGRGRGKNATAAANTSTVSQFASSYSAKKSQILNLDDSDNDIIEAEEEDECCKGKPSGIKKPTTMTQKRVEPTPKAATNSTRRTRIQYEEDEDDDDLENRYGSTAKKSKAAEVDDREEEATNTFSIFRKVANKKKL